MKEIKEIKGCGGGFSYGRCFSIIYRHGKMISDRLISEYHLTVAQSQFLGDIYENPGISQDFLVKYHKMDKGSVAKSLKRMEENGYIRREHNPEDKRVYRLYSTPMSDKCISQVGAQIEEMEAKFVEGLTDEEIAIFQDLLTRVTDNIERYLEEDKR